MDFYEALRRAQLTKYQYAAWFVPVSWLPAKDPTTQSEPLDTLQREDIARRYELDSGPEIKLGTALRQRGHIEDDVVAEAIDEGPSPNSYYWFQWEVDCESTKARDELIGTLQRQAATCGRTSTNYFVDSQNPQNPRFLVQFIASGFHATINALKSTLKQQKFSLQIWSD